MNRQRHCNFIMLGWYAILSICSEACLAEQVICGAWSLGVLLRLVEQGTAAIERERKSSGERERE